MITSPDPVPLPLGPCAAIVTTEGMTSFATGVTAHALTAELPEVAPELPEPELPEAAVLVADELADPDVQPPTTNAATSTTHGDHRREPRGCSDSVTSAPWYRNHDDR